MRNRVDKAEVGAWNARCDRCGWKFKNYELHKTWDNLFVCRECWEPRHPQDFVRGVKDDPSVPWSRPDHSPDDGINFVGDANITLDSDSDTLQKFETDLTANRTVTLSTSFDFNDRGKQFQVFRRDDGNFDLDVGGLQTIPLGRKGEVTVEWTGNAWQLVNYKVHRI